MVLFFAVLTAAISKVIVVKAVVGGAKVYKIGKAFYTAHKTATAVLGGAALAAGVYKAEREYERRCLVAKIVRHFEVVVGLGAAKIAALGIENKNLSELKVLATALGL